MNVFFVHLFRSNFELGKVFPPTRTKPDVLEKIQREKNLWEPEKNLKPCLQVELRARSKSFSPTDVFPRKKKKNVLK